MYAIKDSKKQSGYFSNTEKDALRKSLFGVLPSNIDLDEERRERLR